ncbi:RNA-directed DNA polymerase, eukaryota, partial [Tanacetum coccineum]
LPTRVNLSRRGVLLDSHLCPLCNAAMEDVQHVFFQCAWLGVFSKQQAVYRFGKDAWLMAVYVWVMICEFGINSVMIIDAIGHWVLLLLVTERYVFSEISLAAWGRVLGIIDLMRQKNKRMKQKGLIRHYEILQKMEDSTRYAKEGNMINIKDLLKRFGQRYEDKD